MTDYVAQALRPPPVTAMTINEFLGRDFPPRENILAPWLGVASLALMYATRGTGKTLVAHGVAWAAACGGGFLNWKAPQPRRVLLIDGEMRAGDIQERFSNIRSVSELEPEPDFLKIAAADTVRDGLPNLHSTEAQQLYADVIGNADLVIVDNLSTLCPTIKENDADSLGADGGVGVGATAPEQVGAADPPCRQGRDAARFLTQGGCARHGDVASPAARLLANAGRPFRGPFREGARVPWSRRRAFRGAAYRVRMADRPDQVRGRYRHLEGAPRAGDVDPRDCRQDRHAPVERPSEAEWGRRDRCPMGQRLGSVPWDSTGTVGQWDSWDAWDGWDNEAQNTGEKSHELRFSYL